MEVVTLDRVLFAGAAAVAVGGAAGVGLARQPLRAALALMAHLLGMAGLFLLLGAALVAVAQVLVYAGAVMVLFVFVIMILGRGNGGLRGPGFSPGSRPKGRATGWLAALGGAVLAGVIGFAAKGMMGGQEAAPMVTSVARGLVVDYLVPFEVVSVLLLAVMVGVVVLARES